MESVDVVLLLHYDLSIVIDGLVVLRQFGQAVSSVVESLDVVLVLSQHDLSRVVLDRCLIPLQFAVHQASVREDDRVLVIKFDGLVEVSNRLL